METPSMFLIGKLDSVLNEISKGLGAKNAYVYYYSGENLRISLTMPELTKEFSSVESVKNKIVEYFGLDEKEFKITVTGRYSTSEFEMEHTSNGLRLTISGI